MTNYTDNGPLLPMSICARKLLTVTAALFLTACAVGPDFERPEPPEVDSYTAKPLPSETVSVNTNKGDAQKFLLERDLPAQWWELFRSEELNQLIQRALLNSPDLQAAEAALQQARENLMARSGARLPSIDLKTGIRRQLISGASYGQPELPATLFTLYDASVDVSYDLDLFGRTSRALESLSARVESEKFRREAAYLALTGNVVLYAIHEASLREQIAETELIAKAESKQLALLEQDYKLGGVSKSIVITQRTTHADVLATLPPLQKELAYTRNQLSVLAGQLPGKGLVEEFRLSDLHLPTELPLSLPSDLVQQRPDIKIAASLLHAANAEVGVATANMFPQITLSGSYGVLSPDSSDVFSPESIIWNLGAGLAQPLFRGGQLKHQKQAAIAGLEQATAEYRSTVLKAFQNVADTLQALQYDAETLAAQYLAERAAAEYLDLTVKQLDLGAIDFIEMTDAQRRYHRSKILLIQSQAGRISDTVALFQALGGGWWNREES